MRHVQIAAMVPLLTLPCSAALSKSHLRIQRQFRRIFNFRHRDVRMHFANHRHRQ
jgi:hypothetical protein